MIELLCVGCGGFLGAVARYGLSGLVHRLYGGPFPAGTLLVNVLGCVAIGALMTLVEERQGLSPNARLFLLIGVLGSLTTFSTFGHETVALLRDGDTGMALLNILGSVFLGLGAVLAGGALVRLVSA
jgi:CrcB protein